MGNFYSSALPSVTLESMREWKGEQRKEIVKYITKDIWQENVLYFINTMESERVRLVFERCDTCLENYLYNIICDCSHCDHHGFPCDNCRFFFIKPLNEETLNKECVTNCSEECLNDDLPDLECTKCETILKEEKCKC
jgi:hypothetical protein